VPPALAIPPEGPAAFTDVRWFAELDSTNRYLVDEARAGAPAGVVAVADHQTAGRGRLGRVWVAPPGASLLTSVLLRPVLPAEQRHLLVTAAGLAMAEAVEATTAVVAGMKRVRGSAAHARPAGAGGAGGR
jgi:BirA family biotin operon repressor/biotin-[acetyl-CoA-carboxylase] ligase